MRTEELRWRARRTDEQTKEGANGRGTALMEIERATESPSFAARARTETTTNDVSAVDESPQVSWQR